MSSTQEKITICFIYSNRENVQAIEQCLASHTAPYYVLHSQPDLQQIEIINPDIILLETTNYFQEQLLQIANEHSNTPIILLINEEPRNNFLQHYLTVSSDYFEIEKINAELLTRSIRYALERKNLQQQLQSLDDFHQHITTHDPLTGLPNRQLFYKSVQQHIDQFKQKPFAVLLFDLDDFRTINETLGHEVGDELLSIAAIRLQNCLDDDGYLARLGGDEFAIIVPLSSIQNSLVKLTSTALEVLRKPIIIEDQTLYISASMGITLYPDDGQSYDELHKNADLAMYQAKAKGKNNFCFYKKRMSENTHKIVTLTKNMRHSLDHSDFQLHFQPQINCQDNTVIGVEALLRWPHTQYGAISPTEFIPIAEDSGLIIPLSNWVIEAAAEQLASWQKQFAKELKMAINVSAKQFEDKSFLQNLLRIVDSTGLAHQTIELELTESMLMGKPEKAIELLNQMKGYGFKISLDDFGTGYSSLSYLKRFPIDTLKIDASFVRDILKNFEDASIVKAIISLGETLNMQIIAEGVELLEQQLFLQNNGCHLMQGYHFSKPLPADRCYEFLAQNYLVNNTPQQMPEKSEPQNRRYY